MRWIRFVGLGGLILFLICAFTPVPNILDRWVAMPPHLERADAIVVLGSDIWPDGVLTNGSMRRALQGILLYRRGLAPLVVFLGSSVGNGTPEAEVRAELARELGLAPVAILTEAGARTTREEAARTKALLGPKDVRRILLVTSSHHMVRARRVFQQAGFDVRPAPVVDLSNAAYKPGDRLELMQRVVQELIARIYYRVRDMSHR